MTPEEKETIKGHMMSQLEYVMDPELGVDIVNLGLVYDVDVSDDGVALVTMTLTSMGCPSVGDIIAQLKVHLEVIPGVEKAEANIVWSPPWTKDKMSRYAKIALGVHE
ncbi:metal-sulfur cluster assembly factor [Massilibacterium senegalense]|uniref:metal-sulfur cluster assembly factor n=1 Tax=Massilibacterium senegalense TaxID=1632858 RepID=UPI0007810835|nr:metal-sulfur cluster assembly factor [Massilibacterium senegalense]